MTKTVLVCGGREFDDWHILNTFLYDYTLLESDPDECKIITGDAKGADWLARAWAKDYGMEYEGFPANWKKYGRIAGLIRNQQILDEGKPDLVIAFKGGNGTADMVKRAENAGVKVVKVY